jgi:uncharacterized protein (DUF2267 family)
MSANGLEVFDKTLQTTHIWLDQIMEEADVERHVAWKALGVVLRTLRDRVPVELAAHLSAELPLLIRGAYYDQYQPALQPVPIRSLEEFLAVIGLRLEGALIEADVALEAVLATLTAHIPQGMVDKMIGALPAEFQEFWRAAAVGIEPPADRFRPGEPRAFEDDGDGAEAASPDEAAAEGEPLEDRPRT